MIPEPIIQTVLLHKGDSRVLDMTVMLTAHQLLSPATLAYWVSGAVSMTATSNNF